MDEFYEQYLIKKVSPLGKTLLIAQYLLAVIAMISLALMKLWAALTFTLVWAFIFIICRNVFVDYEYAYLHGELTISRIIRGRRRKTIANLQTNKIQRIVEDEARAYVPKKIHACLDRKKAKTYIYQTTLGDIGFILNTDETMDQILTNEMRRKHNGRTSIETY